MSEPTMARPMPRLRKLTGCLAVLLTMVLALLCAQGTAAFAEGSADLVANGGYRPYTERYGASTTGVKRRQTVNVAVSVGEHVLLGTSVVDATLGSSVPEDLRDCEIHVIANDGEGTEYFISVSGDAAHISTYKKVRNNGDGTYTTLDTWLLVSGDGFIANHTQEAEGPRLSGSTTGFRPIDLMAERSGTWEVDFYSKSLSSENPTMALTTDDNFIANQKGGTVAAWDVTVTNNAETQVRNGRVYTNELFLNMGGNKVGSDVLDASAYVYTDDGFTYNVDFNGMDPFGFVFYANNRGLLYENTDGTYQSLYHSVITRDNQMNGLTEHNILLNLIPTTSADSTYKIFFNKPDPTKFPSATTSTFAGGTASDFTFTGKNTGDATTYVGDGGTFSFTTSDPKATSYKIKLTFANGSTVTLGNNLVNGANSVIWDGRDGLGQVATATNTITSVKMEFDGGETHFPMMDVENSRNGIKITNVTPNWNFGTTDPSLVYYDNVNDDPDKYSTGWDPSISGWTSIAGGNNYSATGVSSAAGTMSYSSSNQFDWPNTGNQAALDLWTYVSSPLDVTTNVTIKDEPTSIALTGTKTVQGQVMNTSYNFVVKEGALTVATGTSSASTGVITFTPIKYTQAGTHTYTVTEVAGENNLMRYDSSTWTATVTVSEDPTTGALSANASYSKDGTAGPMTFTNIYTPTSTTCTITAQKDLVNQGAGQETLAAGEFTFDLCDASTGSVVDTAANDANGTITFKTLEYTKAGIYTYYVKEMTPADTSPNWTYDTSKHRVQVVVKDVSGHLRATIIKPAGGLVIKNLYREDTDQMVFWGVKNLDGTDLTADQFKFGLYLKSINGDETQGDMTTPIYTTSNDQTGNFIFNWITYSTIQNADRSVGDDYVYVIKEIVPTTTDPTITYDTSEQEVDVHVREVEGDNGDKHLLATSSVPASQGDVSFTNSYTPLPTTVTLAVGKDYLGGTLEAGQFTFDLKDSTGAVVATATNTADGTVTFAAQPITETGEHEYTITEEAGDDPSVTYDTSAKVALVEVSDNAGQLQVDRIWWGLNEGDDTVDKTFTNTYTAPVTATLDMTKELTGATLTEGEFSFTLADEKGATVETVTNAADGAVTFSPLTFTKAGTYTYTVTEAAGDADGITYDTSTKAATITVTEDSVNHKLVATTSWKGDDSTFSNTYTPSNPESPDSPETPVSVTTSNDAVMEAAVPKTSDATDAIARAVAVVVLVGAGTLIAARRLRRHDA